MLSRGIYRSLLIRSSRYKAVSLPASFSGLKTATAKSGDIHFLVNGQSFANGTAYNEKLAAKPLSSARIYDSIYVRRWDTWLTPIFLSTQEMTSSHKISRTVV